MRLRAGIALVLWLAVGAAAVGAQQPESADPILDRYRAEKSIEVGRYYLKKGNYDAAIERFQEAALLNPVLARPHRLLGEVYEKKGEKREALASYQKYLEILPSARDADAVRKRIARLARQLERGARRRSD